MADSKQAKTDIFTTKVVPIMDRVRDKLQSKMADEREDRQNSMAFWGAAAAGPDGGESAMRAISDSVYYTGEWNTKTVEDYIDMVKAELKKNNIQVDAAMEKKMIDRLIKQQMPKSTVEYIIRKAGEGTIFYIPQRARTSSLQDHINKEGEKRHDPSLLEDVTGALLGWAGNAATTMGIGGFWGQTAMDVAAEGTSHIAKGQQEKYLAEQKKQGQKEVAEASKKKVSVPKWMLAQMGFDSLDKATDKQLAIAKDWATKNGNIYRDKVKKSLDASQRTVKSSGKTTDISVSDATIRAMQYESFVKAIVQEQKGRAETKQEKKQTSDVMETSEETASLPASTSADNTEQQSQADQTAQMTTQQNGNDYSGWNHLLDSMGLSGIGDTANHLGVTLAMLPDMLLGILTGKTKSVGLNSETMIPLASILCGTFIKNPMLKIPLMLYGGASLVNKMGQEGLERYRQNEGVNTVRYKHYDDEELDKRISSPHIEGNVLIVDIDHIPRIITLPQAIVEGYQSGALPLNTIANRILAKTDQMAMTQQQSVQASERYEQSQQQTVTRTIGQR